MNRLAILASLFASACTDAALVVPDAGPEPADPRCIPFDSALAMFGTTGHDELRDVAVTASGSILITGYEDGRETSTGELVESRGVVLEYANGFTRRITLDTAGADSFESLAVASDTRRTWLAARTSGAIAGLPSYGGFDFMIGDLDAAGFHPSVRGHDSTHEHPRQLAAGAGLVAIAGHEERPMPDGSTSINPFLAAFGASEPLAPLWTTTRRIPPAERYTAVDVAPHAIVTGGNLADGPVPGMFLTVRDDDAFILWQRHLSMIGTDTIAAVRVLPDGDVLWAGTTSAALGETNHGGADIVVGRIEGTSGFTRWTAQLGTARDEHVSDMAIDDAGHIYLAGDVGAPDAGGRDVFFLELDAQGHALFDEQWSSEGDDVPTALAIDRCGTAVLVGHTTGDLAGPSHGARDGFVIVTRATR